MPMKLLLAAALSLAVLAVPPASAEASAAPPYECMDVYRQTELAGGYWLVQRSSCQAQLYWCPAGFAPPAPPCEEVQLATAAAAQADPGLDQWPKCAPIAVGSLCVTIYWPGCNAWIEWTAIPNPPTCLYRSDPLLLSTAAVQPPALEAPPIYCMPYERRLEAGPVTVIQGGCGNDVRLCDDSVLGVRSVQDVKDLDRSCLDDAAPPLQCSDIYARHEVGPVAVVMTSGCSGHAELCDDNLLVRVDTSCLLAPVATQAAAAEPNCLSVYSEYEVGPVRHVQRDSCHSETYVCGVEVREAVKDPIATSPGPGNPGACLGNLGDASTGDLLERRCLRQGQGELQSVTCVDPQDPDCLVYRQQITGVGSQWWCYPSGEHGSDW